MSSLETWKPTDNYRGSTEIEGYLVAPVSQSRDTGILDESNFSIVWKTLEKLSTDKYPVDIHHFGDWMCGWFDLILIHPKNQLAISAAENFKSRMEDYPILNDDDYNDRCQESLLEAYNDYGESELRESIENEIDVKDYPDFRDADECLQIPKELERYYRDIALVNASYDGEQFNFDVEGMTGWIKSCQAFYTFTRSPFANKAQLTLFDPEFVKSKLSIADLSTLY
jgi:hypothetical protein